MGFEIVHERDLTDEEIEFFRNGWFINAAGQLCTRRQALLTLGAGVAFAAAPSLLLPTPAEAQIVELAQALFQGTISLAKRVLQRQETIRARFDLINGTNHRQTQPAYAAVRTPGLGISDEELIYVPLAPRKVTTIDHSGFEAKTAGENDYLAKTQIDQRNAPFQVS